MVLGGLFSTESCVSTCSSQSKNPKKKIKNKNVWVSTRTPLRTPNPVHKSTQKCTQVPKSTRTPLSLSRHNVKAVSPTRRRAAGAVRPAQQGRTPRLLASAGQIRVARAPRRARNKRRTAVGQRRQLAAHARPSRPLFNFTSLSHLLPGYERAAGAGL